MKKKILHVLTPDKFTIPFIQFINKEFDPNEHLFLCSIKPDENLLSSNTNVRYLHSRYRYNFIKNTLVFYGCIREASKIILYGNPSLDFFMLFPSVLNRTYWAIYGYELSNTNLQIRKSALEWIQPFVKRFVLKRIYGHISHIRGDSELANIRFKSSAKFFYSQVFLSNVVSDYNQDKSQQVNKSIVKKILVGNSASPSNDHASIFTFLLPYKDDDILIYCPLSYGIFHEYRDDVIKNGQDLFGDKFVPMTDFMKLEEYNSFLGEIDIAIFNHNRQEAMGVTLTLLNMGKTVYMNSQTTSYQSLIERGFKVFDNNLIAKEGLYANRDVTGNPDLVYKNYSYEMLISSLTTIFND